MWIFKGASKQTKVVALASAFAAAVAPADMTWAVRIMVTALLSALGSIIEKVLENYVKKM